MSHRYLPFSAPRSSHQKGRDSFDPRRLTAAGKGGFKKTANLQTGKTPRTQLDPKLSSFPKLQLLISEATCLTIPKGGSWELTDM